MVERIGALVRGMIGVCTATALLEELLPNKPSFRAARIGIGLCCLAELFAETAVILWGNGG